MITVGKSKPLFWTAHSKGKMNFYRLSAGRVKRIIHSPERIEVGIAPNTIAMMQSVKSQKHPYEIWTMIQETRTKRRVISAWRYPGITKPGDSIPEEILRELKNVL
ncbi:MAG: hypothetical protein NUV83_01350 [Candidatus Wolfebacteria bacterium]|nr:hypothetical protein [Candidatus Wolfebacteria bacterium]